MMGILKNKLKVGDKVKICTYMGVTLFDYCFGTVVKIYKNGIYKVMPEGRRYGGVAYKFRPNGIQCGTTWKDWTTINIEEIIGESK